MSPLSRLGRRAVLSRLGQLSDGQLAIREGDRVIVFGSCGELGAEVTVHSPRFFTAVGFGGHVGAAESFMYGDWDSDDLTALVRILVRNRQVLDGLETGFASLAQPLRAVVHALRRNTRDGSRRNIRRHYDLGNEMFAQFLDDTMTYSCGIFEQPWSSLRDASEAKYERICQKLDLGPRDHVVEIGGGWGGFAIHASSRYGCRVTTSTISDAQRLLAEKRVAAAGLSDRISVLNCDYRDLRGTFDKLVSIEMIEAVGHHYFRTYFRRCTDLLKPHGLAAVQAITIEDRYYESARREVDFIKRHLFPGSCIPSLSILAGASAQTDLRLVHLEDITPHYPRTLRRWRERFRSNWGAIRSLGYSEEFRRLWEFYLSYCEGGFEENALRSVQLVFAKPRARRLPARLLAFGETGEATNAVAPAGVRQRLQAG